MAVDMIARAMAAQSNRELTEFGAGVLSDTVKSILLEACYPVGTIYKSAVDRSPAAFLGGTWKRYGSGRTLVSVDANDVDFNAAGKTGGEKAHTLTEEEIANHRHTLAAGSPSADPGTWSFAEHTAKTPDHVPPGETYQSWWRYTGYVYRDKDTQPHNNMSPYITCYMWVRTA